MAAKWEPINEDGISPVMKINPELQIGDNSFTGGMSLEEVAAAIAKAWNDDDPEKEALTEGEKLLWDIRLIGIQAGVFAHGEDFLIEAGAPEHIIKEYRESKRDAIAQAAAKKLGMKDYRPLLLNTITKEQEKVMAEIADGEERDRLFCYLGTNYRVVAELMMLILAEEIGTDYATITDRDDWADISNTVAFLVRYFFAIHGKHRTEGTDEIEPLVKSNLTDSQREELHNIIKTLVAYKQRRGGGYYENVFDCFGLLPTAKQPAAGDFPGLFKLYPTVMSFTSVAIDALALARTIGERDQINGTLVKVRNVEITSKEISKLGVGEQKLLKYATSIFTKVNGQNEKKPKLRVYGSTRDFASKCIPEPEKGIIPRTMPTPEEQQKENKRAAKALDNFMIKLKKNAKGLLGASFRWEERTKGKIKTYSGFSFISAYRIDPYSIMIEFTQSAAEYLVQRPVIETPTTLYAISDTNPNAYAMADAMAKHYGIHNNVMVNTEQVLKVETLLSYTTLGDFDANGRKRSQWDERVKEPFEKALDELTAKGFFRVGADGKGGWQYVRAGQVPLTDEEAQNISSYAQWLSLYVKYDLADFAPHEERKKTIADRKEAEKDQAARKRKNRKKEPQRESQVT